MERISRSMDAALTAIYIMTSPKMPKQVFLDDVMERIIMFGKFQLTNTIYPEFDPVYRIHGKNKGDFSITSLMLAKHTYRINELICSVVPKETKKKAKCLDRRKSIFLLLQRV